MKNALRQCARLLALLAGLVVCYTLLLLAAYAIPDQYVEPNVNAALGVLRDEGNMKSGYAIYFWHNGFGLTDNLTDITIYKGLLRNGRSVVDAAMRTDYPRYWHGYAAVLRPLSTVLSIIHIRYVSMLMLVALLAMCYYHCRVRLGGGVAFAFVAALGMSFFVIAPFCYQYATMYYITLLACLGLLVWWERLKQALPMVFLALGSLTCFFDFLTYPVLGLGFALVLCLLMSMRGGASATQLWKRTIGLSAAWLAGYALTWLSKALVGSLLCNVDVLGNILEQVRLRTMGQIQSGDTLHDISYAEAIGINLETFFMTVSVVCFGLMLLVYAALAVKRRLSGAGLVRALPVLVVALWPFLWYMALKNHVRVHFWMTNKMLSVTVFAALAYLCAVTPPPCAQAAVKKP